MILLVKKNCPHCPTDLSDEVKRRGGEVFLVIRHPDGSGFYMETGKKQFSPLRTNILGLPALIMDDEKVIIGRMPIEKFLYQEEVALCK